MIFADAFFVSKSENRNQVHYAVAVDAQCKMAGTAPMFARWKMLEKGEGIEEPLLDREQAAYGITSQSIHGGRVRIVLRALPSRPVIVETYVADGTCRASARMTVAGSNARLFNVHAALRWPFGVDYLLLQGWTDDGKVIREKVSS